MATQRRRATTYSNAILVGFLIFFALALAYALVRSRAYPPGTLNGYFVLLASGCLACAAALRLPEAHRQTSAVALVTFVVGGYLVEGVLACCVPAPDLPAQRAAAARLANQPYDTRTRYEVIVDLRQAGQAVYPSANAAQLPDLQAPLAEGEAIVPLGGMALRLTLHCNESGTYTFYPADEHGFNNPAGLYGTSEMVLLGDSFGHGNCVAPGQDIASQLRARGLSVLNLSYSGNGPLLELATLREYAAPLEPKIVLWLYYEGNDLEDLAAEAQNPLLLNYLQPAHTQGLLARQAEIDELLAQYVERRVAAEAANRTPGWRDTPLARVARLQHLRDRLSAILRLTRGATPPPPLFGDVLRQAQAETQAWGGSLYLVYLPGWKRYAVPLGDRDVFYRDPVLTTALDLGIPVIDLHPVFQQHPDPLALFPFRLEGHYTAEGYALAAAAIEAYVRGPGVFNP